MRVLHLNAGNETGGGMHHILSLLSEFDHEEVILGLFERGSMFEKAIEMGIPVVLFEQHNQKDLTVLRDVIKYLNNNDISLLHTHGPRATFFSVLIKRNINQPIVTTIHSNPNDDFVGKGLIGKVCFKLHKWAFKYVDHFIVVSKQFSEVMHDDFEIAEKDISTVWNGIDFDENAVKHTYEDLGLKDTDYNIIMVARLEPVKRHDLAISAFKYLVEDIKNAQLILIGEGSQKDRIKKMIIDEKLSEHVHLLGYKENAKSYIEMSDLCLLTSKSESFPLVLLEAARGRTPIVTTDVGDVKKLIPNSSYGKVVSVATPLSLANAMLDTVLNKDLSNQLDRTYHHAKINFSLKHLYIQIRQIYEGLTEKQIQCKKFVKKIEQ